MSETYSAEQTNIVAIQAAVLDIVVNHQNAVSFVASGLDALPAPEDLAPKNVNGSLVPQLPAAYVMTPVDVSRGERIPGLNQKDWKIDVYCIWPYQYPSNLNDTAVKNAQAALEYVFDQQYDLEGTCSPTALARGFQKTYWGEKDNDTDTQWVALTFSVYAHEDLDIAYLPPL